MTNDVIKANSIYPFVMIFHYGIMIIFMVWTGIHKCGQNQRSLVLLTLIFISIKQNNIF
ncbi:hypothetical protein C8D96_0379 [Kushneria marisflavi]|nr:hypothetical protein C8D96_0379 [Kushneria marisflavi]